jgi:hypothetical protein
VMRKFAVLYTAGIFVKLRPMKLQRRCASLWIAFAFAVTTGSFMSAAEKDNLDSMPVDGQSLGANVERVVKALDQLESSLPEEVCLALANAIRAKDAARLQTLLDSRVLLVVHINPEARVKVSRGPANATLQQGGYTLVLVKVLNESGGTQRLRIGSPQAGVGDGIAAPADAKQHPDELRGNGIAGRGNAPFLEVKMFNAPPMNEHLSGLAVEYAIALIRTGEAGRREATIMFDVGQGTQDLAFRAEVPVLFTIKPAALRK